MPQKPKGKKIRKKKKQLTIYENKSKKIREIKASHIKCIRVN